MKRNFILNLIFIMLFIAFLVISFMIKFFFFIPIISFIPFTCKANNRNKLSFENKYSKELSPNKDKDLAICYCSNCDGKITKSYTLPKFY